MIQGDENGAGVPFSPFWIYLGLLGVAVVLQQLFAVPVHANQLWLRIAGYVVITLSVAMIVAAHAQMMAAKTPVPPWKPTSRVLSHGVFRISRNPIYTGMCLNQIGIGLALNSVWIAASALPTAWLSWFLAIRKEEPYLEQKFGREYIEYRQKTRRWL